MAEGNMTDELQMPDAVAYQPSQNSEVRCGTCEHFQPPGRCAKVAGEIDPTFVCDLWESPETERVMEQARNQFPEGNE